MPMIQMSPFALLCVLTVVLCVSTSPTARAQTIVECKPVLVGRSANGLDVANVINDVHFTDSANAVAVGDQGLIAITGNRGESWTRFDFANRENISAVHMVNSQVGYLGTRNGNVFSTSDGGRVWRQTPSATAIQINEIFFSNVSNGYTVTQNGRILRTTNGGQVFAAQYVAPGDVPLFDIAFQSGAIGLTVGTGGLVVRTTDQGNTWTPRSSSTTNTLRGVGFINDSVALAVGDQGTIIRTTDFGLTYSTINSGTTANLFDITFRGPDTCYVVGAAGTLLVSFDRGVTWQQRSLPTTSLVTKIISIGDEMGYALTPVSANGQILRTNDRGESWVLLGSGSYIQYSDVQTLNPSTVVLSGTNGTLLRSDDDGTSWRRLFVGTSNNLGRVHFVDQDTGYVIQHLGPTSSRLLKTVDAGLSWVPLTLPSSPRLNDLSFLNGQFGSVVGNQGVVFYTANGGQTWIDLDAGNAGSYRAVSVNAPADLVVVGDSTAPITGVISGLLKRYVNGANTVSATPTNAMSDVAFGSAQVGYAVGASNSILFTRDGGATWTRVTSANVSVTQISSLSVINDSTVYALANNGRILGVFSFGADWQWLSADGVRFAHADVSANRRVFSANLEAVSECQFPPRNGLSISPRDNSTTTGSVVDITIADDNRPLPLRIQVSFDSAFRAVIRDTVVASVPVSMSGLASGVWHYWRYTSVAESPDRANLERWGQTYRFLTAAQSFVPGTATWLRTVHGTDTTSLTMRYNDNQTPGDFFRQTVEGTVQGPISVDRLNGRLTYKPDLRDVFPFGLRIQATNTANSDTTVYQYNRFVPVPDLYRRENTALSIIDAEAVAPSARLNRPVVSVTARPRNREFNYLSGPVDSLYTWTVAGTTVVIENGHPNGIYNGTSATETGGQGLVESVAIAADTVIVRGRWWVPQADISIAARVLRFETGSNSQFGQIVTSPYTNPIPANGPGAQGLPAGALRLHVESVSAPVEQLVLADVRGGSGQSTVVGTTNAPGSGGAGGAISLTSDPSLIRTLTGRVLMAGGLGGRRGQVVAAPGLPGLLLYSSAPAPARLALEAIEMILTQLTVDFDYILASENRRQAALSHLNDLTRRLQEMSEAEGNSGLRRVEQAHRVLQSCELRIRHLRDALQSQRRLNGVPIGVAALQSGVYTTFPGNADFNNALATATWIERALAPRSFDRSTPTAVEEVTRLVRSQLAELLRRSEFLAGQTAFLGSMRQAHEQLDRLAREADSLEAEFGALGVGRQRYPALVLGLGHVIRSLKNFVNPNPLGGGAFPSLAMAHHRYDARILLSTATAIETAQSLPSLPSWLRTGVLQGNLTRQQASDGLTAVQALRRDISTLLGGTALNSLAMPRKHLEILLEHCAISDERTLPIIARVRSLIPTLENLWSIANQHQGAIYQVIEEFSSNLESLESVLLVQESNPDANQLARLHRTLYHTSRGKYAVDNATTYRMIAAHYNSSFADSSVDIGSIERRISDYVRSRGFVGANVPSFSDSLRAAIIVNRFVDPLVASVRQIQTQMRAAVRTDTIDLGETLFWPSNAIRSLRIVPNDTVIGGIPVDLSLFLRRLYPNEAGIEGARLLDIEAAAITSGPSMQPGTVRVAVSSDPLATNWMTQGTTPMRFFTLAVPESMNQAPEYVFEAGSANLRAPVARTVRQSPISELAAPFGNLRVYLKPVGAASGIPSVSVRQLVIKWIPSSRLNTGLTPVFVGASHDLSPYFRIGGTNPVEVRDGQGGMQRYLGGSQLEQLTVEAPVFHGNLSFQGWTTFAGTAYPDSTRARNPRVPLNPNVSIMARYARTSPNLAVVGDTLIEVPRDQSSDVSRTYRVAVQNAFPDDTFHVVDTLWHPLRYPYQFSLNAELAPLQLPTGVRREKFGVVVQPSFQGTDSVRWNVAMVEASFGGSSRATKRVTIRRTGINSADEQTSTATFGLFPQPSDGRVQLRYTSRADVRYRLVSPTGAVLGEFGLPPAIDGTATIDHRDLPTGVYYLILDSNGTLRTVPLVIQH